MRPLRDLEPSLNVPLVSIALIRALNIAALDSTLAKNGTSHQRPRLYVPSLVKVDETHILRRRDVEARLYVGLGRGHLIELLPVLRTPS